MPLFHPLNNHLWSCRLFSLFILIPVIHIIIHNTTLTFIRLVNINSLLNHNFIQSLFHNNCQSLIQLINLASFFIHNFSFPLITRWIDLNHTLTAIIRHHIVINDFRVGINGVIKIEIDSVVIFNCTFTHPHHFSICPKHSKTLT
ncbi:hypothetical protein AAHE18_20G043200 [Arachis hypogaea]